MINALIVDDERNNRENSIALLAKYLLAYNAYPKNLLQEMPLYSQSKFV